MLQCKQWECECSNIKSSESSPPRLNKRTAERMAQVQYEMCISLVERTTPVLNSYCLFFHPSVFSIPTDCPFPIIILEKVRKRFPFNCPMV